MKRINIYKGVAAFALVGMLTACSSDYLDVEPTTSIAEDQVMSTPTGVGLAVGGIVHSMNTQYSSIEWIGSTCGEAFVNIACVDALGPDFISGLFGVWSSYGGNLAVVTGDRNYSTIIPWTYYYTLISQANSVIAATNEIEGADDEDLTDDAKEYMFYRAQALTFRAHAYQKLLALYGPRYEDSKNGEELAVVLRLERTYDDLPLSSYKAVVDQIYSDLDEALELYDKSGLDRDEKKNVNADVANGVYARIALLNHDWKLAQEHAAAARKSYKVMDADTYLSGFTDDCDDFIWHCDNGYEGVYYWSFGARNACNGAYTMYWGYGAGAINIDLYRKTDENDIRRKAYLTPDKVNNLSKLKNPGGITEADFWNSEAVNSTGVFLDLASGTVYNKSSNNSKAAAMYNVACWMCYEYATNDFKGSLSRYAENNDDGFYNYQYRKTRADSSTKDLQVSKGVYVQNCATLLGAQMKFWADQPYGNSAYPWMRASEMCLAEAEAYYMMGDEANAKKCLTELMSKRVSGYTCTTSGEALLDEIRTNRSMELFMEGQSFTDYKRWNVTMERREWIDGDPTSGNAVRNQVMNPVTPSDANGWRYVIPYSEYDYNALVNKSSTAVDD